MTMSDDRIKKKLSNMFVVDTNKLLLLVNEGKDILLALSELTGKSREEIKILGYSIMYSEGELL